MQRREVEQLEAAIEEAIESVLKSRLGRELPVHATPKTIHLMSKAAVTVYECAFENQVSEE